MLTLYIFATSPSFGPVFMKLCDYIALGGFICIMPSLLPTFMIIIICLFKTKANRPWYFASFQPNGVDYNPWMCVLSMYAMGQLLILYLCIVTSKRESVLLHCDALSEHICFYTSISSPRCIELILMSKFILKVLYLFQLGIYCL